MRKSRLKAPIGAFFVLTVFFSIYAYAAEGATPFLPCVTIGVPVGAMLPPGACRGNKVSKLSFDVRNNNEKDIGVHVSAPITSNQFLDVPVIPQILGANYAACAVQPIAVSRVSAVGSVSGAAGAVNTVLSPVGLSWNLRERGALSERRREA